MLSSFIFTPVCIAQCAICAVQFLCPKLGNNLTLVYIYDTGEYLGITKMEISPFSRLNELGQIYMRNGITVGMGHNLG